MFHAYAQSKRFGLDADVVVVQHPVDVARGVARGEHNCVGAPFALLFRVSHVLGLYTQDAVVVQDKPCHPLVEMDFAAVMQDGFAHVLHHARQFVGSDVRVCIGEDVGLGAVFHKQPKRFDHVATFHRTGVQFAVGIRACAAFAEAVVGMRVYFAELLDIAQVAAAFAHVAAPVDHDGFDAQFDELEGGEIPCRTGAHDDGSFAAVHGFEAGEQRRFGRVGFFRTVHFGAHAVQRRTGTGVERHLQNFEVRDLCRGNTRLAGSFFKQKFFVVTLFGCERKIDKVGHGRGWSRVYREIG